MKAIRLITILILTNSLTLQAQVADYGQNPPSLRWKYIQADKFDLVFPEQMESEALRLAAAIDQVYGSVAKSLQREPAPITIVLQNQGVESNGFVLLAPRRTEFFAVPPQDVDPNDWLTGLAVHELRHVVQIDKSRQGFSKLISVLFGEEAQIALFGITLPPWFYEGDAVGIETLLSQAGRGRLPAWEIEFRANVLDGKKYSYSKAYLGSFKDMVPDHYRLGYFMVTKLRRDYGDETLNRVLDRTARYPFIPYPFSSSVKKYTGLRTKELYKATVNELDSAWKSRDIPAQTSVTRHNRRKDRVETHYLFPAGINDNLICLKKGLANTSAITMINRSSGKETTLKKIGFQNTDHIHYGNGKVVWDEMRFDKRYEYRSWSVICILDLASGKTKRLTKKTRYFAPSLSPDASKLVAVEWAPSYRSSLVVLDAENGYLLKRFEMPAGNTLQTPVFSADGTKVFSVVTSAEGKSFISCDLQTGKTAYLMPFMHRQISRPAAYKNYILFNAEYSGKDELYAYDLQTREFKQITRSAFGAFNPQVSNGTLLYNDFTSSGFDIVSIPLNEESWIKTDYSNSQFISYFEKLIPREHTTVLNNITVKSYTVKKYPEWKKLFYFHSLTPFTDPEIDFRSSFTGLRLKSTNILNTLNAYAGYGWRRPGLNRFEAGLSYKKYYPFIDLDFSATDRILLVKDSLSTEREIKTLENTWRGSIGLPFSFSKGSIFYYFRIDAGTSYTTRTEPVNAPSNFISRIAFPAFYQLRMQRNQRRSARDLAPRFGQNLTFFYTHSPGNGSNSLAAMRTLFYFPGILPHHSLSLRFNEQEDGTTSLSSLVIPLPRGNYRPDNITGLYNSLLIDYRFPLFYPDLELSGLAYVKRIRAGLFADFENVSRIKFLKNDLYSYGFSLDADMHLLRFYLPLFEIGGTVIVPRGQQTPLFTLNLSYSL